MARTDPGPDFQAALRKRRLRVSFLKAVLWQHQHIKVVGGHQVDGILKNETSSHRITKQLPTTGLLLIGKLRSAKSIAQVANRGGSLADVPRTSSIAEKKRFIVR
ncbi:hypothetical protein TYRP_020917 [Tyrophagus putrescentiae]|nr:hypothetical protein TYRP_020917 [Tyrophagus putrescentiae]